MSSGDGHDRTRDSRVAAPLSSVARMVFMLIAFVLGAGAASFFYLVSSVLIGSASGHLSGLVNYPTLLFVIGVGGCSGLAVMFAILRRKLSGT